MKNLFYCRKNTKVEHIRYKVKEMNNKKIKIYGIRWLIQAAEKAGWTIGGYKLAYEISGDIGLLALNITMLIAATATSGLLNASNINFNWNIISNSVKLRVISFLFFILKYDLRLNCYMQIYVY